MAAAAKLAFAEPQLGAEFEDFGNPVQGILADQIGAQARHVALWKTREAPVKFKRDGAVEYRVADEFKPFVVWRTVAAVSQRGLQKARLGKAVAERLLEPRYVHLPWEDAW